MAPRLRQYSVHISRANRVKDEPIAAIVTPVDVLPYLEDIRTADKEHFVVIGLDARNVPIYQDTVSIGTMDTALIHPREVFSIAIAKKAASIILSHNHPSGDTKPSHEDITITERLVKAGMILGISVIDHLIVGQYEHTSLKESGAIA